MGGLIAQVEGEPFGVADFTADVIEAFLLQGDGALAEPRVLRHAVDEGFLERGDGRELLAEFLETIVIEILGFAAEHAELAGEPVAEVVSAGHGFSLDGGGTGREL